VRYTPLTDFLRAQATRNVRLTFGDIERVLGRKLPASARRHQAWWSNTKTHSYAKAWMDIGWRTRALDLASESIVFERGIGTSESATEFRHAATAAPKAESADPVTFDRAKLNIAARRILDDYTVRFGGDVQAALDLALEEARIAYRQRLLDRFPRSGRVSAVDSVDLIREDRDAR
jgi:hypothetical protein